MSEADLELLTKYAREGCEAAFAEVVQRHVDLVYSAALRHVRSPQLAEEVAQSVFLDLAKNIPRLKSDTVISAWLYQVTHRTAVDAIRRESRRQVREQIALDMNASVSSPTGWEQIQPLLDDGMAELDEADRTAVLLRFLEGKSLREVGQAIGLSDDAAQKRVSRALDRLRSILQKRGVMVGASTLAVILSTYAVQAAPIGLTSAIVGTTAGTAVAGTSFTLTATKTILMTTLQKTLGGLIVAGAVGVAVYQTHKNTQLRQQLAVLDAQTTAQEEASVTANNADETQVDSLKTENSDLAASLAEAQAEKKKLAAERDDAQRMARLYKELADSRENTGVTNKYPTQRHVTAAMGKLMRKAALGQESLRGKKWEELTPEERNAMMSGGLALVGEYTELAQAALKFGQASDGATPKDLVDEKTVLAYGALDLSEQQFQQTYSLLQRLQDEAATQNLLGKDLSPESRETLKALNERGLREFQQFLKPEQTRILQLFGPNIPMVGPGTGWSPMGR